MTVEKKDNYTYIISGDKINIIELKKKIGTYMDDNLIFNCENIVLDNSEIDEILELSNMHKKNSVSFVLINNKLSIDDIDENLIIAPTIIEAEDIISMENLERELGF